MVKKAYEKPTMDEILMYTAESIAEGGISNTSVNCDNQDPDLSKSGQFDFDNTEEEDFNK